LDAGAEVNKPERVTSGQRIWREKREPKRVTEDQKVEIRKSFLGGETMTAIAKRYDLAISTISRVMNPKYNRQRY